MEKVIRKLIANGEGTNVEFKECQHTITNDVYQTVCAFLNSNGGEILLGVCDNGTIQGIIPDCIEQIKKDFVSGINNITKINPPVYLGIEEVTIDDAQVIYVIIPESSQVHRCNNKIYVRNNDADLDITNNNTLVSQVFLRKQTSYSENKIYPHISIEDLRSDLISRARKLAKNQRSNHPWTEMDDFELLKSAQLYQKNYATGEEGFTLSAVLLLGKDEVLLSVLPHFKTDAIKRVENIDRYDDRDCIQTNLLESYDRIMAFAKKHLPEKFYLENGQRINLRDLIFREIAVNTLIHREFLNPYPAKIVIEKDKILAENSNKPHIHGHIDPSCFHPFPKNPIIAKFFREIGWAEELGSGVKNLFKYSKEYTGYSPAIADDDIFKLILPINLSDQGKLFGYIDKDTSKESDIVSDIDSDISDIDKPSQSELFNHIDQNSNQNSDIVSDIDSDISDIDKSTQSKLFNHIDQNSNQNSDIVSDIDNDISDIDKKDSIENLIIDFCAEPKSLIEIMKNLGYKNKPHFLNKIIKPLIKKTLLQQTIPEKPTSRNQKYVASKTFNMKSPTKEAAQRSYQKKLPKEVKL